MQLRRSIFGRRWIGFILAAGLILAGGEVAQRGEALAADLPKVIKIGFSLPLTGPISTSGIEVREGAEAAAKAINDRGGIAGSKVELVFGDDRCAPTDGATEATRLTVKDKVNFMVVYCSSSALAAIPIVAKAQTPFFVLGTAESITGKAHTRNVFRLSSGGQLTAPVIAKYAVKERGKKRFAAIAGNSDFGRSLLQWFEYGLKKHGGEVKQAFFHDVGNMDFAAELDKVRGMKDIDGLYVSLLQEEYISFAAAYRKYNMTIPVFGNDLLADYPFQRRAGKRAAGFHYTWVFNRGSKEPAVMDFVDSFNKQFGRLPGRDAGWAWGALHIAKRSIEATGTVDPEKNIDYIYKNKFKGPMGEYGFASCGQGELLAGVGTYDENGEQKALTDQRYGLDTVPGFCPGK